jgi:hypothetical protein
VPGYEVHTGYTPSLYVYLHGNSGYHGEGCPMATSTIIFILLPSLYGCASCYPSRATEACLIDVGLCGMTSNGI